MTPERYKIIGRLFDEALELARDQRAAWLDQVCRADSGLRQDVKTLLGSQKEAHQFLSRPAMDIAAVFFNATKMKQSPE